LTASPTGYFPARHSLQRKVREEGEVTMRTLLIFAAIIGFSGDASAQAAAPNKSAKPKPAKPSVPMDCKLVGTVKGIKIWSGDCATATELRGTAPAAEPAAPAPTPEANPAARQ
jgi:hypothetical protein